MYDKKHRHIIKTALHLFRVYGLRSVTMDEIATGAGVSKKTIYVYFRDKNELIGNLYDNITRIVEYRLTKIQAQSTSVVSQYIQIIELAMHAAGYITRAVVDDLKKFYTGTHKRLQRFLDGTFVPAIISCIEEGKQQGFFQPIFNSSLMARICISELDFLNTLPAEKFASLSAAETRTQLTQHLLYGIATTAGKRQTDNYFLKHS